MPRIKKVNEDILKKLEAFHGALVPGLIIGAYMVELAYDMLGDADLVDAAVESKKCIADSVQIMTGCTLGNGWLTVYDWGIFAITLFDKRGKDGVRVHLDTKKMPKESLTYKWFFRKVGKGSHDEVNKELLVFKKSILTYEFVKVNIKKEKSAKIMTCVKCAYPFPYDGSAECKSCRQGSYYINNNFH